MPADRSAFLAIAALLGERVGLSEAAAVRRLVRSRGDDPLAARLAARAVAAGLDPSAREALELVDAAVGLDSDAEGKGGGPYDGRGRDAGPGDGDPDRGHPGASSADPSLAEAGPAEAVAAALREAAAASRDSVGSAFSKPGPYGGWTVMPFALSIAETSFAGAARIWYDRPGAAPARMVVDFRSGGKRNLLDVRKGPEGLSMTFRGDDPGELEAFRSAFSAYGAVDTGSLDGGDLEELDGLRAVDGDA